MVATSATIIPAPSSHQHHPMLSIPVHTQQKPPEATSDSMSLVVQLGTTNVGYTPTMSGSSNLNSMSGAARIPPGGGVQVAKHRLPMTINRQTHHSHSLPARNIAALARPIPTAQPSVHQPAAAAHHGASAQQQPPPPHHQVAQQQSHSAPVAGRVLASPVKDSILEDDLLEGVVEKRPKYHKHLPLNYQYVLQDHNYGAPPPPTPPALSPTKTPVNGIGPQASNGYSLASLGRSPTHAHPHQPHHQHQHQHSASHQQHAHPPMANSYAHAQNLYNHSRGQAALGAQAAAAAAAAVKAEAESDVSSDGEREVEPEGEETETAPEGEGEGEDEDSITRCICDFQHDDGYMICCDRCSVWQHVDCMGIDRGNIPDEYLCEKCKPRRVDKQRAIGLQIRKRREIFDTDDSSSDSSSSSEARTRTLPANVPKTGVRKRAVARRRSEPASRKPVGGVALTSKQRRESAKEVSMAREPPARQNSRQGAAAHSRKKHLEKRAPARRKNSSVNNVNSAHGGKESAAEKKANALSLAAGERERERERERELRGLREQDRTTSSSSLTSGGSSTLGNPSGDSVQQLRQWIDNYEEAVTNHYSPELRARIASIKVNGVHSDLRLPSHLLATPKCRISLLPSGIKILMTCVGVPNNQPLIELRGKYMLCGSAGGLISNRPPRPAPPPPGPHIFHYKLPRDSTEVCVDCRTYGNDARFVRRSCRPNAEIRHCIEKGTLHLYLVTTMALEKNSEVTLCQSLNGPAILPCACGEKECRPRQLEPPPPEKRNGVLSGRAANAAATPSNNSQSTIEKRRRGRRRTLSETVQSGAAPPEKAERERPERGAAAHSRSNNTAPPDQSSPPAPPTPSPRESERTERAAAALEREKAREREREKEKQRLPSPSPPSPPPPPPATRSSTSSGGRTTKTSMRQRSPTVAQPPVAVKKEREESTVAAKSNNNNVDSNASANNNNNNSNTTNNEKRAQAAVDNGPSTAASRKEAAEKKKKMTREERKMEAIMKAFERMEKDQARRQEVQARQARGRKDSTEMDRPEKEALSPPGAPPKREKEAAAAKEEPEESSPASTRANSGALKRRRRKGRGKSHGMPQPRVLSSRVRAQRRAARARPQRTATASVRDTSSTQDTDSERSSDDDDGDESPPVPPTGVSKAAGLLMALSTPNNFSTPDKENRASVDENDVYQQLTSSTPPPARGEGEEDGGSPPRLNTSNSSSDTPPTPLSNNCLLVAAAVGPLAPGFKFPKTKKGLLNSWFKAPEPGSSPPLATNVGAEDSPTRPGPGKKRWLRQAISEECDSPNGRPDVSVSPTEHVAPLKKRRMARESMSSEQSFTPPTTPIGPAHQGGGSSRGESEDAADSPVGPRTPDPDTPVKDGAPPPRRRPEAEEDGAAGGEGAVPAPPTPADDAREKKKPAGAEFRGKSASDPRSAKDGGERRRAEADPQKEERLRSMTPARKKVLSISEYRQRKEQGRERPDGDLDGEDGGGGTRRNTVTPQSARSHSSDTSSISSSEDEDAAGTPGDLITKSLLLESSAAKAAAAGPAASISRFSCAPTLVERQRENLTERLRREFGLFLSDDEDQMARRQSSIDMAPTLQCVTTSLTPTLAERKEMPLSSLLDKDKQKKKGGGGILAPPPPPPPGLAPPQLYPVYFGPRGPAPVFAPQHYSMPPLPPPTLEPVNVGTTPFYGPANAYYGQMPR